MEFQMLFLNVGSIVFLMLFATGSCFINAMVEEPLKFMYSLLGSGGRAGEPPTLTARPAMPLNSARSLNRPAPRTSSGPAPSVHAINDLYQASNFRQLPAQTYSNLIVMPLNTNTDSRSGMKNRRGWMIHELTSDSDYSSSEEDWDQNGRMPAVTQLRSGSDNRGFLRTGMIKMQPAPQLRAHPNTHRPFQSGKMQGECCRNSK